MKVTLTELSPIKRQMVVSVDAETVEQAYAKAFKEALKMLSLPGFRRGKVPAYMGRKYIPNSMLKRDVLEMTVPSSFTQAARQENLEVVSSPNFSKIEGDRGQELTYTAEFEVLPTVDLKDYEGVKVEQERYQPTEEDVNTAIERTRAGRATLGDVTDRGLQADDIAFVDYKSYEEGSPIEGGQAENFPMELSPASYVPGFLENLYGMKPGETREFDIEFPADHKSPLAGHKVHFVFTLHSIKERVLPELNEEFVKAVSQFNTVEELRQNIMQLMEDRAKREAEQGIAEKVYFAIAPQVSPEIVPASLVAYHARAFNDRVLNNLKAQRQTLEDMLKAQNRTAEDWNKHVGLMGFGEARLEILVKNLARLLDMKVDEEDINKVIDEEAAHTNLTAASLRRKLEKNGMISVLRYSLLRDKVTQYLVDHADVTFVAPKTPEERAAEEAAKAAEAEAKTEEKAPETQPAEAQGEEAQA